MPELPPACFTTLFLTASERDFLDHRPQAVDMVPARMECGLKLGHRGAHHAFGQTSTEGEWWLRWSDETGADRELLVLAGCSATIDDDICTLPARHVGGHSFELDRDRRPIEVSFFPDTVTGYASSRPRFPTTDAALEAALSRFNRDASVHRASLWSVGGAGSAELFPRDARRVQVLGSSRLADQIRGTLPFAGWHVVEVAAEKPLTQFHFELGNRIYNLLARNGFEYVEDVRMVSDEALLTLSGMGRGTVSVIRAKLGGDEAPPADVRLSTQDARQLGQLLDELADAADGGGHREAADSARKWSTRLLEAVPLV